MGKLTEEREALFLAAQHCQGGHSAAGAAIAKVLGVPFPIRMDALVEKLRSEGQNPATFYPWLRYGSGSYFTAKELADARLSALEGEG